MKSYVQTNIDAHKALNSETNPPQTILKPEDPFTDFVHGLDAGTQGSVSGLGLRGKMPDTILPEQAPMAMRIGSMIGQLAGDLPAMAAGMITGAAAGPVGAAAASFAAPAAIRKMLTDHYQKGDITDPGEFSARLMATTWEALKGGATGAAAALTGGIVSPVAGKMVGMGAELAAMTTTASALEGHLPKLQDFVDGAVMLGGLHGLSHITGIGGTSPEEKLQNVYAATGEKPADIIAAVDKNVTLKQDIIAGNQQEPSQAAPTTIKTEPDLKTIYHGTNTDFSAYDFNRGGGMVQFAEDPQTANRYAEGAGGGRSQLDDTQKYVVSGDGLAYELTGSQRVEKTIALSDGEQIKYTGNQGGQWEAVGHFSGEGLSNQNTLKPLEENENYPALSQKDAEEMVDANRGSGYATPKESYIKSEQIDMNKVIDTTTPDGLEKLKNIIKPSNPRIIRLIQSIEDEQNKRPGYQGFGNAFWTSTKAARDPQISAQLQELTSQLKEAGYHGIKFLDDSHTTIAGFDNAFPSGKNGERISTPTTFPKTAVEMGAETAPPAPPSEPPEPPKPGSPEEDIAGVLSHIGESEKGPEKTWREKWNEFYTKNVDYLNPWNLVIKLANDRGAEIGPEENAENKARESRAWMDTTASFIRDGVNGGEGIEKILKELPDDKRNLLRAYAMAQNALEEFNGKPATDTREAIPSRTPWENFDKAQAERVVAQLAPEYDPYNQRLIKAGNDILDWAAQKGRYSKEQVQAMKDAHDFYSPQSRAFESDLYTGEVSSGSGSIKTRVGDERNILDPLMQRYVNTEKIVKSVLINDARNTLVKNLDEGNLIKRGDVWNDTTMDPALTQVSSGQYVGERKEEISTEGSPIINRPILAPNQIAIFNDGVREVYEGSPLLIDSMKRLDGDATAMDLTSKVLRSFTNALRIGVVSNPAFGFAHFFRSQVMAGVNSQTGLVPFFHPAFAIADMLRNSDDFKTFIAGGGGNGRYLEANSNWLKTDLPLAAESKAPTFGLAWNAIKKVTDASESFIKLTDTASKFSEYQRSLAQGAGQSEALANARSVVPDYSNVGLQRSVIRTGVAFIGAHINSLDNMAKVAAKDPMGVAMRLSVLTGMSAALWMVNKNDEAIDAIPDWQKNTYWNINISRFDPSYKGPQDATIVRLPKPWAPGILFGSGIEVALDNYMKYRPQEFPHFAASIMKSVVPDVVPNIAQPVLDQYSNKQSFTGRPLVPDYKAKLLPEMQYSPFTSETAKNIAKLIGYVPLVKDIGPSTDTLASPAVVENYIHAWTGTIGGWALKASDWAGRGFTPSIKAEPWQSDPFVSSFMSRYPSFSDQRIQDFYENKDAADRAFQSAKAAAKAGDFASAMRIQAAHPDYQVRLDGIAEGISTARKVFENVQDNPSIPNVQKRQLLDTTLFQIGSMAKEGNKMMNDFHATLNHNLNNPFQSVAGGNE
jgi:hypothetical protein